MNNLTRLLTNTALGSRLNLSRRDVLAMVERNQIPFVRLPNGDIRFQERDVVAWIERLKSKR